MGSAGARIVRVVGAVACMVSGAPAAAQDAPAEGPLAPPHPELAPAAWVAGCWRRGSGHTFQEERWSPANGDAMVGINRTVRNGRLAAFEYLQIRLVDGRLTYVALPSGQAETMFPLAAATDSTLVFENLEHDFPQRIGYTRAGVNGLDVWIEGASGEGVRRIPFSFLRVSCD